MTEITAERIRELRRLCQSFRLWRPFVPGPPTSPRLRAGRSEPTMRAVRRPVQATQAAWLPARTERGVVPHRRSSGAALIRTPADQFGRIGFGHQ